jgi:hypothetical protein
MFARQSSYLALFLADMQRLGVNVILLGMPLDAANRALLPGQFWSEYRTRVSSIAKTYSLPFYDYSDSCLFRHGDFADGVHLNWKGTTKLESLMTNLIAPHVVSH